MTLDEAIKKYENIAKYHADPYSNGDRHYTNKIMAKDYSQLAEWLKELKELKKRVQQNEKAIFDIQAEINTPNLGTCDYFIVDSIEEIIDKYKTESVDKE